MRSLRNSRILTNTLAGCQWHTAFFCFLFLATALFASPAQSASPEEVLTAAGLQRVERVWLTADEAELRGRLAELERLDKKAFELRKQIQAQINSHEALQGQLQTTEAAFQRTKELQKGELAGSPIAAQLDKDAKQQEALIAQLKKNIPAPQRWGNDAPLAALLREAVANRAELCQGVATVRRSADRLPAAYPPLQARPEIAAALAALNPPQKLGPAKTFEAELKTLARLETAAWLATVPIYREGPTWRLNGLALDEFPLTFTLDDKLDLTLLPRGAAETLGLKIDESAATQQVNIAGMNVAAWHATLASLRLGNKTLTNVDVLVLSAEGEHAGARLGYALQNEFGLRLDPAKLQATTGQSSGAGEVK